MAIVQPFAQQNYVLFLSQESSSGAADPPWGPAVQRRLQADRRSDDLNVVQAWSTCLHGCDRIRSPGHLLEMLNASGVSATLEVAIVPELPGARELITSGIVSTLHAENARCQDALVAKSVDAGAELLFDPQTAGGLLAGIPAARAEACIAALRQSGYPHVSIIGSVRDAASGRIEVELL